MKKNNRYLPRKHFHNVMMNPHFTHDFHTNSHEGQLEKKLEDMLHKAIHSPIKVLAYCIMPIKRLLGRIKG